MDCSPPPTKKNCPCGTKNPIELPTENWVDIFGFLDRKHLAVTVSIIGDHYFSTKVQHFLHEYGAITLGELCILLPADGQEAIVRANRRDLPLTSAPMPKNIKSFKRVEIRHIDLAVIAFMRQFQDKGLLKNANLCIRGSSFFTAVMTDLAPMMPTLDRLLITGIGTLDRIQCECREHAAVDGARVLNSPYNCRDLWFCDWLYKPRADGQPRHLILSGSSDQSHHYLVEKLKQDFISSTSRASFIVYLDFFRNKPRVEPITLKNETTGEWMIIKMDGSGRDVVVVRSSIKTTITTSADIYMPIKYKNVAFGPFYE